jgi:sulfatase maturation enzyme AslB (radical SAM superfamily)
LVTNGSIRSSAWWQQLAQKNYSNLQVVFSIDGLEDVNHLYRIGLNYKNIMDNVQSFISNGGHATWKFILFHHNEHQLDQICKLSRQLGFEQFIFTPCRSGDFAGQTQWPVLKDGTITHYLEPPHHPQEGRVQHIDRKIPSVLVKSNPERICPNLSNGQVYITHQNYVIPCCMMHFDTELQYIGTQHLRTMTGGFNQQSLVQYSMSEVLNHEFFNNKLKIDKLKIN